MIGKKVSAEDGSVAIGRDNNGIITNITIEAGAAFHLVESVNTNRSLGTYLGKVISFVAEQSLSEYGHSYQRLVTNEVQDKLDFNHISQEDLIVRNYRKYYYLLDRAYKGVEQSNNDARVLVRLRAGSIYADELTKSCTLANIPATKRIEFSTQNAHSLMEAVKRQLVQEFNDSQAMPVEPTWVDLAVSLLVADAVAECEVLEKEHKNVATT